MGWPSMIQVLDEKLLLFFYGRPVVLVPAFYVATLMGGGYGLITFVPFLLRKATCVATQWLLGAIAVQALLVATIKAMVGRPRPFQTLAWCQVVMGSLPGAASFPSGHAAGSFALAGFLAVRAPRWAPLAFLWAAIVAASRCVLGVHYPSDIGAGALLGALVGVLFGRLSERLALRLKRGV